jgi:hypothetical protein
MVGGRFCVPLLQHVKVRQIQLRLPYKPFGDMGL